MKLQIQKRKQQRIQDLIKKQEQEATKLKNLKELKDKQLKLVQNNVRRARQRQQQQQQQQQDQEAAEVSTYIPRMVHGNDCIVTSGKCGVVGKRHITKLGTLVLHK